AGAWRSRERHAPAWLAFSAGRTVPPYRNRAKRNGRNLVGKIKTQSTVISKADRAAPLPASRLLIERRVLDARPARGEVRQDQYVVAVEHVEHVQLRGELITPPEFSSIREQAV